MKMTEASKTFKVMTMLFEQISDSGETSGHGRNRAARPPKHHGDARSHPARVLSVKDQIEKISAVDPLCGDLALHRTGMVDTTAASLSRLEDHVNTPSPPRIAASGTNERSWPRHNLEE